LFAAGVTIALAIGATVALASWNGPSVVVSGGSIGVNPSSDRQIAADGDWAYAVWTDASHVVHFSRSSDNGVTWAEPTSFSNLVLDTYRSRSWYPSVAAADNKVYVVWVRGSTATTQALGGIVYGWVGSGNGATSAANPATLVDSDQVDRYWTGVAAVDASGTPYVYAFHRLNGTGLQLRSNLTSGTTWNSAVTVLSGSASGRGRVSAAHPGGVALLWVPTGAQGYLSVSTSNGASGSWSNGTSGYALPSSPATESIYATATTGAIGVQRAYVATDGVYVQRWTGTTTWATAVKVSDSTYDTRVVQGVTLAGSPARLGAVWSYAGTPSLPMYSRFSYNGGATYSSIGSLPATSGAYALNSASTVTTDHVLYSSATAPGGLYHVAWSEDAGVLGIGQGLGGGSFSGTLTGAAASLPGTGFNGFQVSDGRGTGVGWSVTALATPLANVTRPGKDIAANSLTMPQLSVVASSGSSPVPGTLTPASSIDTTGSGVVMAACNAAGQGKGVYYFTATGADWRLAITPDEYAGSYASTLTLTLTTLALQ
jgi:hypothetical protein